MASIWSAAAATPTAAHRLPADVSAAGIPTYYSVQQIADLYISTGVTANAIGNVTGATAISLAAGGVVTATVTGNTTFSITNPPTAASEWVLILTNGGAHTITWFTTTWAGGTAPTLTASGVDVIHFATPNGGTTWYGWHETDFAVGTTAGTVAAGDDSRMTDDRTASGLRSATTVVSVSAATAPSSGQVLTATSSTAATWQTPSGGGTPGGSDTHVQYNDGGAFGGEAAFTYNKATDTLTCKVYQAQKVNNAPLLQNGTTSADACIIWVTGNELQAARGDIGALIPFQASVVKASTQFQSGSYAMGVYNSGLAFGTTNFSAFANATCHSLFVCGATGGYDTALTRDAAGALNQRNSTNAQTFRVTRSYTDGSNYSWLTHKWNTSTAVIHAEGAGTGSDGSVAFNDAVLATNATVGFLMIPSCAGTPSGTPADIPTGQIPLVWDSTNLKLYAYTGGAWKASAAFT